MRHKRVLDRADLLPPAEYAIKRGEERRRITEMKRRRRLEVGPFATFCFENFATIRHQVQEILHIEKGGEAQIEDELAAYNRPLACELDPRVRRGTRILPLLRPAASAGGIRSALPPVAFHYRQKQRGVFGGSDRRRPAGMRTAAGCRSVGPWE